MNFKPDYYDFVHLLNEVILLFAESTKQKSIFLINELPPKLYVYADKAMISIVLRNLISNAIKFSFPGGKVLISAEENETGLTFQISDSGVGISKESCQKLFRIDQNHTTAGTQREQGTGLGLILCKEFIEKHYGNIWVVSEEGKGSDFYFTIPRNPSR
jgi:signal transduction histidine kinase